PLLTGARRQQLDRLIAAGRDHRQRRSRDQSTIYRFMLAHERETINRPLAVIPSDRLSRAVLVWCIQKLHHTTSVMRRSAGPPAALFGRSKVCRVQSASTESYSGDG